MYLTILFNVKNTIKYKSNYFICNGFIKYSVSVLVKIQVLVLCSLCKKVQTNVHSMLSEQKLINAYVCLSSRIHTLTQDISHTMKKKILKLLKLLNSSSWSSWFFTVILDYFTFQYFWKLNSDLHTVNSVLNLFHNLTPKHETHRYLTLVCTLRILICFI